MWCVLCIVLLRFPYRRTQDIPAAQAITSILVCTQFNDYYVYIFPR